MAAADYSPFQIVAPTDPRLPDGGGYTVSGLFDLNPNRVGQVDNYVTFASKFGKQIEHWNGIDFTVNARPGRGLLLQGGVSTGRTSTDNCEIRALLPETGALNPFCHVDTELPDAGQAARHLHRAEGRRAVLVHLPEPAGPAGDGQLRRQPTRRSSRAWAGRCRAARPTPRSTSSSRARCTAQRLNQLDLRFGKLLRFDRRRASINFDLYNALNGSAVTSQNNNYAAWQVPLSILDARLFKISVQFDF